MSRAARALLPALAVALCACGAGQSVERVYGGELVLGRYVEPAAYAAYLRGVLDESEGHVAAALDHYGSAALLDPESPEIWSRIGELRCAADPRDPSGEAAVERALAIDASFPRAWAARARCAAARHDPALARSSAQQAAALDPDEDRAHVEASDPGADAARARLVALTQTARDPIVAFDALASWAAARGDVALETVAWAELVRRDPSRRADIARRAEGLAGVGEVAAARTVAAACLDAAPDAWPSGHALAGRLAVDEAIARDDARATATRAARARLPPDEAAGRALLAGRRALARELVEAAAFGDPTARGARLVLAAASGADARAIALEARADDPPVSAAALVAFGQALGRTVSPSVAAGLLAAIAAEAPVEGDDRVERAAVALAAHGVLATSRLPSGGLVELAAVRGDAVTVRPEGVDARHELLALALGPPDAARTSALDRRVAPGDPIVAAARALLALSGKGPVAPDLPRRLMEMNPSDPLLASVALRLAERAGDADLVRRARASLGALSGASRLGG